MTLLGNYAYGVPPINAPEDVKFESEIVTYGHTGTYTKVDKTCTSLSSEGRGKGLTQMMYTSLFKLYENVNIFTRTWSTNFAHIKILSKFNFDTLCVLKNHRGKNIDTVYFVKRPGI